MIFLPEQSFITNKNITSCACRIPDDAACISRNERADFQSQLSRALLTHTLFSAGISLNIQDIAGGGMARPYISSRPDLHISLSHCQGLIACAFGSTELGIDAENIHSFDEGVMRRVCSPGEIDYILESREPSRRFFRCWTLKESYGKAMGVGLGYPMREAVFFDGIKVCSNIKDYTFTLFENINGYIIALCHRRSKK